MNTIDYFTDHRNNLLKYGIAVILFAISAGNLIVRSIELGKDYGMEDTIQILEHAYHDTVDNNSENADE